MVTDEVQDLGPDPVPAMSLTGAAKTFGHVVALAGGTVEIRAGEIHALVSESSAGKSTVVKLLAGLDHSDAGQFSGGGKLVAFRYVADSEAAVISLDRVHRRQHRRVRLLNESLPECVADARAFGPHLLHAQRPGRRGEIG